MSKIKKPISVLTTITTIAWLSGVAMLAPMGVGAAVIDGDIVSPDAEFTQGGITYYPYDVFIVKIVGAKTFKRLILNPEVFESYGHLEWGNIQTISASTVEGYTTSQLVRADGETKVYKLVPDGDVGTKEWMNMTAAEFGATYDWDSIYTVNSVDVGNYTVGADITDDDVVVSTGTLTVSLAADTPATAFALMNSTRVPFTKINLTATGGDVIIDSLKVQRTGSPASDDAFSGVNLLKPNGDLLSSSYKTFNSVHQATFTENISIANGTTVSYMIVGKMADVTTYAGEVPTLSLVSVTLSGDATLNATLPIAGNAMTINTTINIADLAITETPDVGTATKEVGTADYDFVHVKLTNSASDSEIQIESIKFNNVGSADDADVANMELLYYNTSEVVATADMVSNYIYFDLSDCGDTCKLGKGKNKTFTLRGDIEGGSGRSLDFDLKRVEHVVAKDLLNNVYVTPTGTIDYGNTVTISRGKLNVTKTDTVKTSNIADDSSEVELGSWNFKVKGESITVSKIKFDIDINDDDAGNTIGADDFTIMVLTNKTTGETLTGGTDGTDDSGAYGDGYVTFTDSFTLPIGDNEIVMTSSINTTPAVNDTVQIGVDFSASDTDHLDATGDVTGDAITLATYATPALTEIDANKQTFKGLTLAVTTLSQPAARTLVSGTSNIHYSTISFDASDSSEDLKITSFHINLIVAATSKANEVQNIRFVVDGTELSETKNGAGTAAGEDERITVSLTGDDQFIVEKGTTATMKIYADLASGAIVAGDHQIQINNVDNDQSDGVTLVVAIGKISGTDATETYAAATANAVTVGTPGGTVEISLDSSNPNSSLLVAGATGVTLAAFKFYATTTEDVELDYVYLTQVTTETPSASYKDYDRIYFVDEDGVEVATTNPTSTHPKLNFADDAFVVNISDTDGEILYLRADLASIGTGYNGRAGNYLGYKIDNVVDVLAVGDSTGTGSTEYLGSGASAPTGKSHYVYKSYPTFSKVAVPTNKLGNGTMDLYKFTITADSSGDIALYQLTFDIATTVCNVTELHVYDVTGTETVLNTTAGTCSAARCLFETDGSAWTTNFAGREVVVSKTQPRTFVLRGNIAGATTAAQVTTKVGGDSAHATLPGDTLMGQVSDIESDPQDDFIWSDKSKGAHTYQTDDWTNGYLVPGLPSSSSTAETIAY